MIKRSQINILVRKEDEVRFNKCIDKLVKHNRNLQAYISGVYEAPADKCSENCKHRAIQELRHVLKFASIMRALSVREVTNERN